MRLTYTRIVTGEVVELTAQAVILDIRVDDVDREHERLRSLVTDWVLPPTDQPWGNRATILRDPDGNLVNLFAPIPGRR